MMKATSIKDSIHGLIQLSAYERGIISSPGFNRLHDVYQNSTLYLTFPCNRTKRYEHSIGTMKICSDMFYQSILNALEEDRSKFYEIAKEKVKEIIDMINSQESEFRSDVYFGGEGRLTIEKLNRLTLDERRKSFIPHGVPSEYAVIQVVLMESVRTAALLHDVGHPPFSHIIEFALENSSKKVREKQNTSQTLNSRELDFLDALEQCAKQQEHSANRKLHEQMGDNIAENILRAQVETYTIKDQKRERK